MEELEHDRRRMHFSGAAPKMIAIDKIVEANPFPGLRAFATNEADRFFGRRRQIEELAASLDEVGFVAVAGSSGCGKSSLVLAGLLSELSHGTEAGNQTIWRAVVMQPGNQPMANLAQQLSSVISRGSDASRGGALCGQLRLGGLGLVETVRLARLDIRTRVLVVVDQFEEIFRFKRMTDSDEATAFVKLLLNAANDQRSPVSVVITLRSDTLGYCDNFRDLPETISRGQYLVPKLTREQRKEAIVGPIELRGFQIAPRLVQRLLNDVSDDFDDLPVMQHILARTWNKWAQASQGRRPIDLEDYEAVGTSKDALSRHAEEAFESLSQLAPVTEKVFRALTECLADGAEVRRALPFNLLCRVVGTSPVQVEQVVERFRRPDTVFLRPGQAIPLTSNPVIDISHESLIRQWPRLRKWAKAEAKSRQTLERLIHAAARRLDPHPGSLWRGRELEETLEWWRSTNPTPAWVGLYTKEDGAAARKSAERFLKESTDDVRRERWRGRLRIISVVVPAIFLTALIVGIDLSKQAESSELASKAFLSINRDPALSAQLALAALEQNPRNENGAHALRQSLATLEVAHAERILDLGAPISDARYSLDGSFLVTASGKKVTMFDSKHYTRIGESITRKETVTRAWLINNNRILLTQTADGQVQTQGIDGTAVHPISCDGGNNPVLILSVGPDDRHVAAGCYDGAVSVWDATDPVSGPKHRYNHKAGVSVTALTFSSDGKYLASGDAVGTVNLWKLGHPSAWIGQDHRRAKESPIKHDLYYAIRDIGFYRDDPTLLVTAADEDKQAIVWDLDLDRRRLRRNDKKGPRRWSLQHERPVIAAKFPTRRGGIPVITVSGKTTQLWENATADPTQLRMHDDWVVDANASSDGELLVTASSDGTARIWSTRSRTPIAVLHGHRGIVYRAFFSPDGKAVVTASEDGTVRIWQFRSPQLLVSSKQWALSARFDPSGSRVAVGAEGRAFVFQLSDAARNLSTVHHDLPVPNGNIQIGEMSWSRDGKYLIGLQTASYIGADSVPILWDVERKEDITPTWFRDLVTAVFSPGTDELLTADRKGRIAVWDMKALRSDNPQSQPMQTIDEEPATFWTATISPDGKWIAASKDNKVKLWKRANLRSPVRELTKHTGNIVSLQFSRDSRLLLTASFDRTALIWLVDRPGPPMELNGGHTARLTSASFSTDSKWVLTTSADSTIGVWDSATAKHLASLHWHNESVNSAEFSDGGWILSASDDGTVKLDQCEACTSTIEFLRKRVPVLAKHVGPELEEIRTHSAAARGLFHVPAFLSREQ